jgi:ATP synthase protein I
MGHGSRNNQAMAADPREPEWKRTSASQAGEVMGVGLQFAASILVFLFLGRWLDGRLGTTPWLLILGVLLGAGAGFFSMYRTLVTRPQQRRAQENGKK